MISIENLSKDFQVYKHRFAMMKELVGLAKEGRDYDLVHSLKSINLSIPDGKVHGIIGMNGAGKSTLLKILTGVLVPTSGKISIEGRVAALLELGTGFHGELTGRQNVYLNGSIMGLTRQEVDEKMGAIEAFAELGEFFDRPVKIYSSGMYVRLAFSLAVSVEPDVLIIDEALSVGDAYFQQKCLKKIRSFKDSGTTILFVSHDLAAVKTLCEEVSLLSHGEMIFNGSPLQALDLYNGLLAEHQNESLVRARAQAAGSIDPNTSYESGTKGIEVNKARMRTGESNESVVAISGDPISFIIDATVNIDRVENPTCGILIRDRLGYDVFGTNTHNMDVNTGVFKKGDQISFRFDMDLNLGQGDYTLTVALHSDKSHVEENFHWIERALIFKVIPSTDFEFIGVSRLNPQCVINQGL